MQLPLRAVSVPNCPRIAGCFCPAGKSLPIIGNRVKPRNKKYFALSEGQIRRISVGIPSRPEGRIMIATIVGRVAVDARSADGERHESVRQRRVGYILKLGERRRKQENPLFKGVFG
jgi:hypothetical protein